VSAGYTRSDDPVSAAGDKLCAHLRSTLERRETARLAIAGGSALEALGPALGALGALRDRVRITWVDERCVPISDPESNRGAAHRQLGALFPRDELPLWLDDESVGQALTRVRAELTHRFEDAIDVTLLGMGGDGHIASLFVGREIEADRVAHIDDSPKPPPRRMTLTRPVLQTASAHVLLAKGEGKRAALERLFAGDKTLPATGLTGLSVVTDLRLEVAAPG